MRIRPTADRRSDERPRSRLWRALAALTLVLALLLTPGQAAAGAPSFGPADPRSLLGVGEDVRQTGTVAPLYFPETGFAVEEPRIIEYFNRRGQVPTFGFPISRLILFQGIPTQFFQRIVVQVWPDGSVRPLNLLDPGLLPYTRINGSTFPAPNERLAALAPAPGQPGYAREVLEFVRANAPDTFNGEPVRFFSTFAGTVSAETAFGRQGGDPNLLPLINLEIWGVPTSLPAQDPNNGNFIYQRFQRGIMHYDASCRCTQGLLLADYFKALLTGENLPVDLAAQASGSPFLRQYAPDRPNGIRQASALPGSDLTAAFARQAAPARTAVATPAVSASSVSASISPSTAYSARIRLGGGLADAIDALETAKLTGPLQTILDSNTDVAFGPLPDLVHARYVRIGSGGGGAIRSIIVNTKWQSSDPKALGTLIVHEAKHLDDDLAGVDPRTPEVCFQFEVRAFTQQAIAWQAMYGANGKPDPRDDLDAELNAWLVVHRRGPGEIEKRVRLVYAEACNRPGPRAH
ncbi:MAG: hypothetical protein IT306_23195 [Chloroflexi bacterium]|nr:hypothetical protein [Chloroflexota bacterium]